MLITNPADTAAVFSCVRTSFSSHTDIPIIATSLAKATNCLVLLKIVPRGLIATFLSTFSRPILNNNVDRQTPCLIPHSVLKLLENVFWMLISLYILAKVILVRVIKLAGIQNSFIASII
jgi:hypothetical protein